MDRKKGKDEEMEKIMNERDERKERRIRRQENE